MTNGTHYFKDGKVLCGSRTPRQGVSSVLSSVGCADCLKLILKKILAVKDKGHWIGFEKEDGQFETLKFP